MIEPRYIAVLGEMASRLAGSSVVWAITGSLGMALQGVDVDVHDIDLQTDQLGAREIERRFAQYVVRPVVFSPSERIRSYLGALRLNDVTVEIIGEMQKRLPSGLWETPVRVQDHLCWVEASGMSLPVMSLEHEYEVYLQMGRQEKARLLWEFLHRSTPTPEVPPQQDSEGQNPISGN